MSTAPTYFRCVADDGNDGYGSIPLGYDREHILVVTVRGVSYAELSKVTPITKEEHDSALRECYASEAWTRSIPAEMCRFVWPPLAGS